MSKHEIRLRKKLSTQGGSERFRNFSVIKKRHEREVRMKRIIRVFTIVAAILLAIILVIAMQIIIELRSKEKTSFKKEINGNQNTPVKASPKKLAIINRV